MKKAITGIIIFIVLLAAAGLFAQKFYQEHVFLNDGYVNGNTAGNLYNAGLFCESNGEIFFSNPDDNGRLYRMDSDGQNIRKINDDTVMYINADDHYIYYVRNNEKGKSEYSFFTFNNNSLCRIPRKGGSITVLDKNPCIYASLIGNEIYYLSYTSESATSLYKVRIDGGRPEQVMEQYVFTCSSIGPYFYYNGMKSDGNLYRYNTQTGRSEMMYECSSYKPIAVSENDIYYMDAMQDCALLHTNISMSNPTVITSDPVDCYNVYGSYIYYQKNSATDPALCRVKNDGSEFSVIANGNYTNIHVTSYFVFFSDFKTGAVFYTSTANPDSIVPFHPGIAE